MSLLSIAFTTIAALVGLLGLVSVGLAIRPRPFRAHPAPSMPGKPAPYTRELPVPVHRHFVETLGETPPVIETAVVWGRGRACIRGVWIPLRFKVWYRPGRAFVRRLELTFFQRPVLRAVDSYKQGKGLLRLGSDVEEGPHVDYNQAHSLWAEAVWMPSAYVHDRRIHWEAVDDVTARLIFPLGGGESSLETHFDALSGRMTHIAATRKTEDGIVEPLRVDLLAWKDFSGLLLPNQIAIAEGESGSPGSYWDVEGVVYNVDVADQLREEQQL